MSYLIPLLLLLSDNRLDSKKLSEKAMNELTKEILLFLFFTIGSIVVLAILTT